jgi:hypothetical protein
MEITMKTPTCSTVSCTVAELLRRPQEGPNWNAVLLSAATQVLSLADCLYHVHVEMALCVEYHIIVTRPAQLAGVMWLPVGCWDVASVLAQSSPGITVDIPSYYAQSPYEVFKLRQLVALRDPRVAAVRADPRVGRGTCTHIDECFEHTELVAELDAADVTTPAGAVAWAHDWEGLRREVALNASSGEPDCALRASYNQWNEGANQ